MLSLAKLSIDPRANPLSSLIAPETRTQISNNTYPAFAALSWAFVMYIFRWYPETLVSSLRSSMVYMYVFLFLSPTALLTCLQLLRLGSLGFIPQPPNTQQINPIPKRFPSHVSWRIERHWSSFVSLFIVMLYHDLLGRSCPI